MRLGLDVNRRRLSWSPAALLRARDGAWFSGPLFRSTADSLLVADTAAQAVTLALDDGQGMALGAPLTIAATTVPANWTDNADGTYTSNGSSGSLVFASTLTAGKVYYAEVTIVRTSGTVFGPYDGGATQQNPKTTSGVHSQYFRAVGTAMYVYSSSFNGTISNIVVREVAGNHAYQATSGNRPVLDVSAGGKTIIVHDLTNDALSATLPDLSTTAVVAWAETDGAHILTGQTVSGATTLPQKADLIAGSVVYSEGPLTAAELARLEHWLNWKAGL